MTKYVALFVVVSIKRWEGSRNGKLRRLGRNKEEQN